MPRKSLQLQLQELEQQRDDFSYQMVEAEGEEIEGLEAALDEIEREIAQVQFAIDNQEKASGN